jgi:hypothetical protein
MGVLENKALERLLGHETENVTEEWRMYEELLIRSLHPIFLALQN